MSKMHPQVSYFLPTGKPTVQGLQFFDTFAAGGGGGGSTAWGDLTGVPSTFPPSAHTHPQSDVVGLVAALAAKADGAATTSALAGKQATILAGTATVTAVGIGVNQTVAAVGVTPSSRVFACLGNMADADENDAEMLDVLALSVVPGTDQITVDMAFATPQAGAIPINWSVI